MDPQNPWDAMAFNIKMGLIGMISGYPHFRKASKPHHTTPLGSCHSMSNQTPKVAPRNFSRFSKFPIEIATYSAFPGFWTNPTSI
jgi:hypothetical protein